MKIDTQSIGPHGKPVITFRTNGNELDILRGLVASALMYTPETRFTTNTIYRLRNMSRALNQKEVINFINKDSFAEKQRLG